MSEEMQKSDAESPKRKAVPYAPMPDARVPDNRLPDHKIPDIAASISEASITRDDEDASSFDQLAEAAEAIRHGHIIEDAEADLSATSDDRLIALLCYWSQLVMPVVMPLIVLLSESGKRRPFQRHHAIQSLGLTGAIIGLSTAMTMGLGILMSIPILGIPFILLAICASPIAFVMIVIAYIFYGWQANQGKRFSIPVLSRFLRRQGWLDR